MILIVGSGESPSPEPTQKPKLAEDETIINPYYMRQLLQYGIRLGQQQNSGDLSPEDLLREATVRLFHMVFPYLSIDRWFLMVSGWSRSSKQSRDANTSLPTIDMNKSEEAPLCIRSLTVFLAKAVYIHLTPGHFVHATSPRHSVCLTTAHVCTNYAKKRNMTRYTIRPSTHALGLHILCYPTHFNHSPLPSR